MADNATAAVLDDIRVLDLTSEYGQYGTKLLADLGADVIKIERPGGDPARRIPPFFGSGADPDKSLSFWYFNTNKRSVVLDLDTEQGRAALRKLVPSCDVVVSDMGATRLREWGLDYDDLTKLRPGLIMAKVSGFGEWGPYKDYKCPDIVAVAMSGMMFLAGFPDAPPFRPYGDQAYYSAGIEAAIGTLLAVIHRHTTGEGQEIEVAAQEVLSMDQETAMMTWDIRKEVRARTGDQRRLPGYGIYECADGHVMFMVGIAGFGAGWPVLIEWMAEEGAAGDLTDPKYIEMFATLDMRTMTALMMGMGDPKEIEETIARFTYVNETLAAFIAARPKDYLYSEGQRRRLLVGIVSTPKDLVENEQLAAHDFFAEVEHPELGATFRYPGAPYHITKAPWRIRRRAPLTGEHTREVLTAAGLTDAQVDELAATATAR